MPYTIKTKDGITINNIPDDIDPNSETVKQRVQLIRSQMAQGTASSGGALDDLMPSAPKQEESTIKELTQYDVDEAVRVYVRQGYSDTDAREIVRRLLDAGALQSPDQQRATVAGLPETALSVVSGAIAEPIAGLAGLAASVNPFVDKGAGARTVENVRNFLTFKPKSDQGKQALTDVGRTLEPSLGALAKIPEAAGDMTLDATGSPLAATAVTTGLTAIPEVLGLKGGKSLLKPSSTKVTVGASPQVKQAERASKATGIDLFEGQQTLSAPALERQSWIAQLPSGVKKASAELSKQNKQASKAVDDILTMIAPDDSIVVGAERFRSAAARAVERKRVIRSEAASPLYKEAFSKDVSVNTKSIKSEISAVVDKFPEAGEVSRSVKKVVALIGDETGLEKLHNAKIEIDQMISKVGEGSLGNTTKAKLIEIKNNLLSRMDEASPEYSAARAKFAEMSPDVEKIEGSIIGKIANLDDTQLKLVSSKIFDSGNVNSKAVLDSKRIIDEVDPNAWNMLLRSEIERRMGSIKPEIGGAIENIPGKLSNAIFGNTKQTNVLLAGATGETKKALVNLSTALKRASLGRNAGSQTGTRMEIAKELRGGLVSSMRDLFIKPLDTIVRTGEDAQFDRRVSSMAEALFDPKYKAETSKLISTGKGKELTRLILSIEALKESGRLEKEAQNKQQQVQ